MARASKAKQLNNNTTIIPPVEGFSLEIADNLVRCQKELGFIEKNIAPQLHSLQTGNPCFGDRGIYRKQSRKSPIYRPGVIKSG